VTFRCQLCGHSLSGSQSQCVLSLPDELMSLVPSHCKSCHWEARGVPEMTFVGPILPPPYADVVRERPGEWSETEGEQLLDPKSVW
jgi:hypothetical protein